jgi:hypothetical protein
MRIVIVQRPTLVAGILLRLAALNNLLYVPGHFVSNWLSISILLF